MNKNIKGVIWIIILIVILVVIVLLKQKTSDQSNASVIKVGVIAPLTGPLAEYGEAFKNGITLAEEKYPNSKLQFIFEDSVYDPAKTIAAFYKLRDSDKVDILFNWGDPTSEVIAPLIKDANMPFVAFTTLSSVAATSPYTVRALNTPEDYAQTAWTYLRSKNLKNIAMVKVQNTYLNNLMAALNKLKKPDEKVTLIDDYLSFGDKDFRTSITKIKKAASSYDALGVYLASGQIGQFYKQAKEQGLTIPTFGTDFFENQSDIDVAGHAIDGAVYVNSDVSVDFKNAYKARYNNVSQITTAGGGYDVVTMLGNITSSDKDSILNTLKSIKNYQGILGSYNYRETATDRYLLSPMHIKLINNGGITAVN